MFSKTSFGLGTAVGLLISLLVLTSFPYYSYEQNHSQYWNQIKKINDKAIIVIGVDTNAEHEWQCMDHNGYIIVHTFKDADRAQKYKESVNAVVPKEPVKPPETPTPDPKPVAPEPPKPEPAGPPAPKAPEPEKK